jgi:hypothetical protein
MLRRERGEGRERERRVVLKTKDGAIRPHDFGGVDGLVVVCNVLRVIDPVATIDNDL